MRIFRSFVEHSAAPREPLASGSERPTQEKQRILFIDVLRGVAVLMILVSNIQEFALPRAGYFFPSVYDDFGWPGRIAWHLDQLLFSEKSLLLFAMLFGVSMAIAADREPPGARQPVGRPVRRLAVLMAFGLVHAYLVWDGDILVCLAIAGLLVLPLRRAGAATLLVAGAALAFLAPLAIAFLNSVCHWWDLTERASFAGNLVRYTGRFEEIIAALRGNWIAQLPYRASASLEMHLFVIPYQLVWEVAGAMVLGIALFRMGMFSVDRRQGVRRVLLILAIAVGLPATRLGPPMVLLKGLPDWGEFYISAQFGLVISCLVAMGWIAALADVVRRWPGGHLVRLLADLGSMTLSQYLLQSLICTLVFYGHGLGRFAHIPRAWFMVIVPLIWVVQVLFAKYWLRSHRLGPVEWLWRRLA